MTCSEIVELDVIGEQCPMPLLKAKRALNGMAAGQQLRVLATDKGSVRDFQVFARQSGNTLISTEQVDGVYIHVLKKAGAAQPREEGNVRRL
jgi:tRNA 2-thiouridine synthesizing protein A